MLDITIALACCHWLDGWSCWCKKAPGSSVPARSLPSASLSPTPNACVALWWGAAAFLTGHTLHKVGVSTRQVWILLHSFGFHFAFIFFFHIQLFFFITVCLSHNDLGLTLDTETLTCRNFFHQLPLLFKIQPLYSITYSVPLILLLLFFVPRLIQRLGKHSEFRTPNLSNLSCVKCSFNMPKV